MRTSHVVLLVAISSASAAAQETSRASVSSTDKPANAPCRECATSSDGQIVAFSSAATNLVPNDTHHRENVFVRDRTTGTTTVVSVNPAGDPGRGNSHFPALSADGRFVAFTSDATDLVAHDSNQCSDAFVYDRTTGIMERVSVDSSGKQVNGGADYSYRPSISADGRFVAFTSVSSDLVSGDTNNSFDVFVRDRSTGITERVSVDSSGGEADSNSSSPSISADGRYVAFESSANNLVSVGVTSWMNVYVHDRTTGVTELVSISASGKTADADSGSASISADGQSVAFASGAANLVPGDTNSRWDVFVRDGASGTVERVSVDSSGGQADDASVGYDELGTSISTDGRYVAFWSDATNLVAGDTNGFADVFVHDRSTGTTRRASVDSRGAEGDGNSFDPALTADGQTVVFASDASNLVAHDKNGLTDVFVHDHCQLPASWSNYGAGLPGTLGVPSLAPQANPVMGSNLAIDVGNSSGRFTFGLLFVGVQRASIHSDWGGDLLVAPLITTMLGFTTGGTTLFGDVPDDDALCGATVDLQAIEADAGAVQGVSFTAGLELVLGN